MNIEKFKKSILITVALQALAFVLCFLPMFNYSAAPGSLAAFGEALMNQTMEKRVSFVAYLEGTSELLLLFMSVFIAAIVGVVIPLIKGDLDKYRRFVLSKICALLTIAIWGFLSSSILDAPEEYGALGFKYGELGWQCELTFGGWLFLIAMAAQIVMLFALSYQSRIISDRKKVEVEANVSAKSDPAKQPVPAGGWRCSCGRPYAAYVSSCHCGMSKRELLGQIESDVSKNRS